MLDQAVKKCVHRKQETEADTIGMILAAQACFDPGAGKQARHVVLVGNLARFNDRVCAARV